MVRVKKSGEFVRTLQNLLNRDTAYKILVDEAVYRFVRNPEVYRRKRMRG